LELVIFDLDNTLIAGDSDYAWGQFLVSKGIVDAEAYTRENDRFYLEYKNKTLNIHEYQQFVLTPIKTLTPRQREQLHQEFMETVVADLRLSKADALIKKHREAGDSLMIITATNRFIAGPIGPWLGIDTVLATEPEIIEGEFTGKVDGIPCFQEGKIQRLQAWLDSESLRPSSLTFYSDSINDLPLLAFVDKPFAVDPDEPLKAHAKSQGWPILSLRDS
jgi:HAD superfamily hydrolase (TIGR01490 family)